MHCYNSTECSYVEIKFTTCVLCFLATRSRATGRRQRCLCVNCSCCLHEVWHSFSGSQRNFCFAPPALLVFCFSVSTADCFIEI